MLARWLQLAAVRPQGRGLSAAGRLGLLLLAVWAVSLSGCRGLPLYNRPPQVKVPPGNPIPRELQKTSLPPYIIEPPDIILIDVVKLVPKPPYTIEPLDTLQISAANTFEGEPINGAYTVEVDGTVNLGASYGKLKIGGLTTDEAATAINDYLVDILGETAASVSLIQSAGSQQITGEHLVGPDGTVNLGTYGTVYISGMTLEQAQAAIQAHLGEYLDDPRVSLDVFSYNSKVYYVILEGAGNGDQITTVPVTGNETVLDALSQVGGTGSFSSRSIWVARPAPDGLGYEQVLPVNWQEIVRGGQTATNYQIFPNDRILIREDKLVAMDTFFGKLTAPIERVFGTTLLGSQTIQTVNRLPNGGGQGQNFF